MILITGGAGYIGSHVNKLLSLNGEETIVFDNFCNGHRESVRWGHLFEGDLGDIQQIRECFNRFPIHLVMHFAAYAYVGESVTDPARYYRNNVANTINLFDVMHEFNVEQVIFSSSCATYGIPQVVPITETAPQHPVNPYGRSKLMIENILNDYAGAYGWRYIVLRYFNAGGADFEGQIGEWHVPETHLIPRALQAVTGTTEPVPIFGTDYPTPDGTCIRDYIHVADVADAHMRANIHLRTGGKSVCYNLGNGVGYSVRDILTTIEQVTGSPVPHVVLDRRDGDPPALVGCADRIHAELGWSPRHDLFSIVSSAWKWHCRGSLR